MKKHILPFVLMILNSLIAFSQPFNPSKMKEILIGVAYYHENMPYERLDTDVKMMKECGINVVRIAESSWGNMEPQDGVFDFSDVDRVINAMGKASIKLIVGTPTYSIPTWLAREHPEMIWGGYGMRQNMDITNLFYLSYSERIIRKLISHVCNNPAVIGYQIDNETKYLGSTGDSVQIRFIEKMKEKFGSTDSLNKAWGLAYWGQKINDWKDFPARGGATSLSYKLEWDRYTRNLVSEFLAWQAKIVNEYKRQDQFITHNFDGQVYNGTPGPNSLNNTFDIAKVLDVSGFDIYHGSQDALDGTVTSLYGDWVRSSKQTNYFVLETNIQTQSWDSQWQYPPYDHQIRLSAYTHLALGANMVEYWHWHSNHYGQEIYWKGLLSHDLQPNREYYEVKQLTGELKKIESHLINLKIENKTAILYSGDSYSAINFQPFDGKAGYTTILKQYHDALFKLNVGCDFILPTTDDWSKYKLIIIPPLYISSDELLIKIRDYVSKGGHVLMAFKSGFCNLYNGVRPVVMPGLLREACGFYYQEFSSINQLRIKSLTMNIDSTNCYADKWAEMIIPEKASVLVSYQHPFFGKYAAVTQNRFGKGELTYQGTMLSETMQTKLIKSVLENVGLLQETHDVVFPIVVKHGSNDYNKEIHYYFNYSGMEKSVTYSYKRGTSLFTKSDINHGTAIVLKPWDVAIIEEK